MLGICWKQCISSEIRTALPSKSAAQKFHGFTWTCTCTGPCVSRLRLLFWGVQTHMAFHGFCLTVPCLRRSARHSRAQGDKEGHYLPGLSWHNMFNEWLFALRQEASLLTPPPLAGGSTRRCFLCHEPSRNREAPQTILAWNWSQYIASCDSAEPCVSSHCIVRSERRKNVMKTWGVFGWIVELKFFLVWDLCDCFNWK